MQLNLKLVSACLFLFVGATVSSANALPGREVKYGSGHVAKRNFGVCQLDPGAVCRGLANACGHELTTPEADAVWKGTACTCAGLWCGAQGILNLLCCLGEVGGCNSDNKFVGDKGINVSQKVINNIATFADTFGSTFSKDDLLQAIQANGGSVIEGKPELEKIINGIMQKLTANGMASRDDVNRYLKLTDFAAGWGH